MEGSAAAVRAPAVVAVVVARDPGPWFDETLRALASQDYPNLSVLVLLAAQAPVRGGPPAPAGGGAADPTATVAAVLPDAFVTRLEEARTFGAAVNAALGMVEGAAFFALCHDDCAPASDAVRIMVEESFRSNAGIVSPKVVRWDDPRALLHVGQNTDKTGKVVERVQDGEVDAGQHDSVRDVFVAPGGLTLVRADLFRALGGYDPDIAAMGEDLDLSWRAHLAGARVVVAPAAVARHLELLAAGRRPLPRSGAPSIQALQRRNELRAVLTCYSVPHLVRVLPQAAVLAAGELTVASVTGDRQRARAVTHAWSWNLSQLHAVRRRRAAVRALRTMHDADLRSLQVPGSARLRSYLGRALHTSAGAAEGVRRVTSAVAAPFAPGSGEPGDAADERLWAPASASRAEPGGLGSAFSEDADFDELDDLGHRGTRARAVRDRRLFATRRSRAVLWLAVAALLVVGTRNLLGHPLPLIGQFVPFASWTSTWHQFFSSWQPAGLGSSAPPSPAFGLLGLLGTFLVGRMGLLQEVLVLGCVPVGAWGVSRLLRPFGSPRASFVGALGYLFLPLPYDALARGRWDGLVAYAATPWLLRGLATASRLAPFDPGAATGWRRRAAGRTLALGSVEAACVAVAPAVSVVVLLAGLGIVLGSLPFAGRKRALHAAATALGATAVAAVLLAPWVVVTAASGRDALAVLGLPGSAATSPGWSGLLRLAVGPVGGSPLVWLVLAAAAVPLLVARDARFAWAVRFWSVALGAWLVALVSAKSWGAPFAPSLDVVLAAAGAGVAACLGLGVAAFESDLAGFRFGWRQVAAAGAVAALTVGLLPAVADAAGGRWGTPATGYASAAGLPRPTSAATAYRVLWLGDPRALPLGGWSLGSGFADATSTDGTPVLADLWAPASPGATSVLARDVGLALDGETVRLGHLLAAARVRYVVVVTAVAPKTPGGTAPETLPVPRGVLGALGRQEDLRTVPVSVGSLSVFENTAVRTTGSAAAIAPRPSATARAVDPVVAALVLLAWLAVAAALLGRRRWLDRWWVPRLHRRRHPAHAGHDELIHVPSPVPASDPASQDLVPVGVPPPAVDAG